MRIARNGALRQEKDELCALLVMQTGATRRPSSSSWVLLAGLSRSWLAVVLWAKLSEAHSPIPAPPSEMQSQGHLSRCARAIQGAAAGKSNEVPNVKHLE